MSEKMALQEPLKDPSSFPKIVSRERGTTSISASVRKSVEKAKEQLRDKGVEVIEIRGT